MVLRLPPRRSAVASFFSASTDDAVTTTSGRCALRGGLTGGAPPTASGVMLVDVTSFPGAAVAAASDGSAGSVDTSSVALEVRASPAKGAFSPCKMA